MINLGKIAKKKLYTINIWTTVAKMNQDRSILSSSISNLLQPNPRKSKESTRKIVSQLPNKFQYKRSKKH